MKPVTYHPLHRNRHRARPYFVIALIGIVLLILLSLVKPVTDPVFDNPNTVTSEEK